MPTQCQKRGISQVYREVLAAKEKYAAGFGEKGRLPLPPVGKFAALTARL